VLDPSREACEEAQRRGLASACGTLGATRLPGGYEAVVFEHSLEHVLEPLEDLTQAAALLADDGLLLVSVPNFGSWQRRLFGPNWFHLDLPRHRSHFSRAGLERLLERAGLRPLRFATSTSLNSLGMSLQYRLLGRRRPGGVALYASLVFRLALAPVAAGLNRARRDGDVLHTVAQKRLQIG
jgi:hypothetical protein